MRCIRRWGSYLALWVLVSGTPAEAQEGSAGAGLARLLQGRPPSAEPEPLRRVAESLLAYSRVPSATVAAAELQEVARLLERARGLAAAGEPASEYEQLAELAWAHLALAGRRMALAQIEQDRNALRRELAALREQLASTRGDALGDPETESGCR